MTIDLVTDSAGGIPQSLTQIQIQKYTHRNTNTEKNKHRHTNTKIQIQNTHLVQDDTGGGVVPKSNAHAPHSDEKPPLMDMSGK